ncbi:MAG TPA: class I SAM-dependent methyltransferase [Ktedonobacteraceae bacterium]|nr:class I SAM-dependent methyltransferase [Ktedonobacteraceae bacterium]
MGNALPRLSSRVESYFKYRPGYPVPIIDLLRKECHLTTDALIADVGSGTGKLTELFLSHGCRVVGIEPDPEMRAAEYVLGQYPTFASLAGSAEATGLPDRSVDVVTAGQAFHWFDRQRASKEFARILIPGGWVVLVWNRQKTAGTPFLVALEQFWQAYLTREGLEARSAGRDLTHLLRATNPVYRWRLEPGRFSQELIVPFFGPGEFTMQTFENSQIYDFEGLKGRVFSAGSAPQADHPRYTEMLESLTALFWGHQVDGTITIEQETCVYYGQLSNT